MSFLPADFLIFEGLRPGVLRRPSSVVRPPSVRVRRQPSLRIKNKMFGMLDARPELIEAKGCGWNTFGNAQENKRGKVFKLTMI